jgi:hypothetical protein
MARDVEYRGPVSDRWYADMGKRNRWKRYQKTRTEANGFKASPEWVDHAAGSLVQERCPWKGSLGMVQGSGASKGKRS